MRNVAKKRQPLQESFQNSAERDTVFNGKPYTISSGTESPESFQKYFHTNGLTAGNISTNSGESQNGMYVCFSVQGKDRNWTMDEVKFVNDVRRVLQTILVKRITKNSLASSYNTLEAILKIQDVELL